MAGTEGRKAAGDGELWLRLPAIVREALYDTVMLTALACVDELLEAERAALCGARAIRSPTERWNRWCWGSQRGATRARGSH